MSRHRLVLSTVMVGSLAMACGAPTETPTDVVTSSTTVSLFVCSATIRSPA